MQEQASLLQEFDDAVEYAKVTAIEKSNLSTATKLELYSYYKQGAAGDVNTPRPSLFAIVERAKWDAWNKMQGTSKEVAMQKYIAKLTEIAPQWREYNKQPTTNTAATTTATATATTTATTTAASTSAPETTAAAVPQPQRPRQQQQVQFNLEPTVINDSDSANGSLPNRPPIDTAADVVDDVNATASTTATVVDSVPTERANSGLSLPLSLMHTIESDNETLQQQQQRSTAALQLKPSTAPAITVADLSVKCTEMEESIRQEVKRLRDSLKNSMRKLADLENEIRIEKTSGSQSIDLEITAVSGNRSLDGILSNIRSAYQILDHKIASTNALIEDNKRQIVDLEKQTTQQWQRKRLTALRLLWRVIQWILVLLPIGALVRLLINRCWLLLFGSKRSPNALKSIKSVS